MATRTVEGVLDLLGMAQSAGTGSVRIGGPEGCFSSDSKRKSLAKPHHVKLQSLEQLRSLCGGEMSAAAIPEPWPEVRSGAAVPDLDQGEEDRLRRALFAYAMGRGDEVASYQDVLARRFLPMSIIVYTGTDIVIKKGEVLRIEPDGHDPVVVNYRTVTLEEGGQIRCEAPVLMIVEKFIKKKSIAAK
jgi:hypothetical protein